MNTAPTIAAPTLVESSAPETKENKRQALIKQALAFLHTLGVETFRTPQGEAFARIKVNDHFENWPIHSDTFTRWLEQEMYLMGGSFLPNSIIQDILHQLEGMSIFLGTTRPVHLRIASLGDKIYIDLCNEKWQVVEVSASGWQVLDNSPVAFRRSPGMQSLPNPVPGGCVKDLLKFINAGNREQQLLLLSWMVMAFRPSGPYPILSIKGSQGSAKSTCQKILRSLIDPSESPLRTAPRDERDLMISAKHSHVVAFDNLSSIPAWLSDSFCRLATGGGLATRQLYTDEKQMIFQASRPILINGIEELAERGDLLDRVVNLHLPPIPKKERRKEGDLWKEFEEAKPGIFGALLGVLAAVLDGVDDVAIPEPPRMADFAVWATAAEESLGFEKGEFMLAYERNRRENSLQALECAPAITETIKFVKQCGVWEGTHLELLSHLNALTTDSRRDPQWPKSGRSMQAVIARAEPNLAVAGIKFTRLQREGGTGARRIRLELHGHIVTNVTPMQDNAPAMTM